MKSNLFLPETAATTTRPGSALLGAEAAAATAGCALQCLCIIGIAGTRAIGNAVSRLAGAPVGRAITIAGRVGLVGAAGGKLAGIIGIGGECYAYRYNAQHDYRRQRDNQYL